MKKLDNPLYIGLWHWSETPFNGTLVRTMPAGGTETAVVYTCEALAALGHRVEIYCNTPISTQIEGVSYVQAKSFQTAVKTEQFDAFIILRHLALLTVPIQTRCLLYWCHDNTEQPFMHGMFRFFEKKGPGQGLVCCYNLGELMHFIDGVLAVSQWQADAISNVFKIDRSSITVIGNGLQPGLFDPDHNLKYRKPIIIYSLPPDRGMLPLLEIYIQAMPRLHGAELHFYSRSTIYGASREEDERIYGETYALAGKIPGVRHFDPVDQPTLAGAMSKAMVYVYPTTTDETFCISILEAQAAGLVPIASTCGAIPERITDSKTGFLVPGDPSDESCRIRFADRLVQVMKDQDLRISVARAARHVSCSAEYSYQSVATRLVSRIRQLTQQKAVRTFHFDTAKIPTPYMAKILVQGEYQGQRQITQQEISLLKQRYGKLFNFA